MTSLDALENDLASIVATLRSKEVVRPRAALNITLDPSGEASYYTRVEYYPEEIGQNWTYEYFHADTAHLALMKALNSTQQIKGKEARRAEIAFKQLNSLIDSLSELGDFHEKETLLSLLRSQRESIQVSNQLAPPRKDDYIPF